MSNDILLILEDILSGIANTPVKITIRGARSFTYSFDGDNEAAGAKLKEYFSGVGQFTTGNGCAGYCPDTNLSCFFHEV